MSERKKAAVAQPPHVKLGKSAGKSHTLAEDGDGRGAQVSPSSSPEAPGQPFPAEGYVLTQTSLFFPEPSELLAQVLSCPRAPSDPFVVHLLVPSPAVATSGQITDTRTLSPGLFGTGGSPLSRP